MSGSESWGPLFVLLISIFAFGVVGSAEATLLGPSPYLSRADSPFFPFDPNTFAYFHLEDFEGVEPFNGTTCSGSLNTPGVTVTGLPTCGTGGGPNSDSVDEDGPGGIDGIVNDASSLNGADFLFTFDSGVLGRLPTHVGIVATDVAQGDIPGGQSLTVFEVFGPGMTLLNPTQRTFDITFNHPSDNTAVNDRFLGFTAPGGILAIGASCEPVVPGCTEWDHFQYGAERFCGDGGLDPGEDCDDGNNQDGDGCNAQCLDEFCGDGIVNDASNEECDDGNTVGGDGCSPDCLDEGAGVPILPKPALSLFAALVIGTSLFLLHRVRA